MQRPREIIITSSGKSNPYPLDRYTNGYGFTVVSTGTIYTLQYSNSDPYFDIKQSTAQGIPVRYSTSYAVSGVWVNWDDPQLVNASSTRSTNLAFPARAVRVNASANVSAGNPLIFQIVPMGMDGG